MNYILGILFLFSLGFIGLMGLAAVVDFHHFDMVWNAKTPEALQTACTSDWYKNSSLDSLPAQCRQFYSLGSE